MTCIKHLANSNLLKMSIKRLESVVLIRIIRHCEMAEESVHGMSGLSGVGELLPIAGSRQGLGPLTGLFSQRSCPGP